MAENLAVFKELYLKGRQSVIKGIGNLSIEAFDWRGYDSSSVLTIGSHAVHILGFDNLVRSAIQGQDMRRISSDPEWLEKYRSGFPRELGAKPPAGHDASYYVSMIEEETRRTLEFVEGSFDPNGVTYFYSDGDEFPDGDLVTRSNLSLLLGIPTHDSYHRGQMNNQKYNFGLAARPNQPQS